MIIAKLKQADIDNLTAVNGRIDSLVTTDLTSVNAKINNLEVDIENVNTLLAGSVTSGSTQTIVLNAQNTTIANALIKSAMIRSHIHLNKSLVLMLIPQINCTFKRWEINLERQHNPNQ